ncbi:glycosyltransferase [Polynucleobacter sp. AP-Kolm-20A-A1]|uniref:glycosyltransferase n=1 Tax=Polynucleobacter sp. AP-Kolm-20A-A1 TaxID=2081041 RepID=UPI001BFD6CFE|nr:glycosyltransferase [Polynucleobacter sp. AP-Kolm-20A-A1]QWE20932.1 glycosyltransferase [Polynucleobacter sp. AP-Kolm-20A-A1]
MKTITIVIPVYFNQDSLRDLSKRLSLVCSQLTSMGVNASIVFVDDGSKDNSWDEIQQIHIEHSNVIAVRHAKNYGTVQAIKTGYMQVESDCYTCIAADLQDPPELIVEMVRLWVDTDYKIILCSRESKSDGFITDFLSACYFKFMNIFLGNYPAGGFDITLIDSSLIGYFRKLPKYMYFQPLVIGLGIRYLQIPYGRSKRVHGKSKNNFIKKIRYFSDSILSVSNYPLRFVTLFSLSIAATSLFYSTYLIGYKILFGIETKGFATLVALFSFLGASIIAMLGIIGEYVWRLYDSQYGLPGPVIEDVLRKNFDA